MDDILVSVIIPTYKRSVTLERAVDSCLSQTLKNIEIIVVDDNIPETKYRALTEKIMEKYYNVDNVIYIKHSQNLKGSAARNTGIQKSRGKFITFLDDDDVLDSEKLEKQMNRLINAGEEFGMVCCGVRIKDEKTGKQMNVVQPEKGGNVQFDILRLRLGMGTGSNPMYTREAVERTGLYDTSFLRHQDTEYVIRVLRNYKMAVVPEVLITKFESGHPNRPEANKYLEIQEHFLEKFKEDIVKYSESQQNEIYRNNWHQICIVAVDAREWKLAKKCYKKAKSYMKYTVKMKLGIVKHILNNKY